MNTSEDKVDIIQAFMMGYHVFREVYNCDQNGFILEGDIEKAEWYKNWHKNKGQK